MNKRQKNKQTKKGMQIECEILKEQNEYLLNALKAADKLINAVFNLKKDFENGKY